MSQDLYPLHIAISRGDYCLVLKIVGEKYDINERDTKGRTPLYLAIKFQEHRIIWFLIEAGADVNIRALNGTDPLYQAIDTCDQELCRYLIPKMKNINGSAYSLEKTNLRKAIDRGLHKIVEILISNGALVNNLVLHYVIGRYYTFKGDRCKNFWIIEILISNGVDVNAEDVLGYTPLHYAASSKDINLVKYLISNGAKIPAEKEGIKGPLEYLSKEEQKEVFDYLNDDSIFIKGAQ